MTSSKVVLITGTSSGIGRSTAQTLAGKGHTVFATMRGVGDKNAAAAEALRSWAANENLSLHVVELDVTDESSVQNAVQQVIDTAGRIDVLINNAGQGIFGLAESFTADQWLRLFETNVFGTVRVTQAVLPHMRQQGEGLLIYISSASATISYPFMGAYGSTKAALEGIAMTLNNEIYSLGIDTVIIQAGAYGSDFGKNVESSAREDIWESYGPIGQAGKGMIAGLPAFFASEFTSPVEMLAEQIAEYIALPSGQRPLKVGIGYGTEGLEALNNVLLPMQTQAIEMFGFGGLIKRQ